MLKGRLSHHFFVCPFSVSSRASPACDAFYLSAIFSCYNLAVIHHLTIDLLRFDCRRCSLAERLFASTKPRNSSTVSH